MQLGTFGAILKYATDIEEGAASYYDSLAALAPPQAKALAVEMAAASRKNKQILERTRRMEMQEMILEAITGIDSDNYKADKEVSSDEDANLRKAVEIESNAKRFYEESMEKLGFLPNVKKTFAKLAAERQDRLNKLKGN